MASPLEYLSSFNDFLEQVPKNVNTFFSQTFKKGEEYTQDFVDACCRWMAWKINIMIERQRQKVIKTLKSQYDGAFAVIQGLNIVKNALSDPIGTAGSVFGWLSGPISKAKNFVTTLMVEIPRLAANLANIASSLPPAPPNPSINFNAFKLQIGTISMAELTGGGAMPSPEEMFPAPPSPFSKATFDSSFENAPIAEGTDEVMYKLDGDNSGALEQAIKEATLAGIEVPKNFTDGLA